MSENVQPDTNDTKRSDKDDQALVSSELEQTRLTTCEQLGNLDKQQLLVEKAHNTFRELCKTLENEQTKLFELEERRKKLQEEMLHLKAEIEEEKQSFNLNMIQSVAENLSVLNDSNDIGERQHVTTSNLAAIDNQEFMAQEPDIQENMPNI